MESLVERAKALAHRAHAGQVDKAGRPYIEHVARVAAAVADDPEAEAVAWLHDVIEDAPKFTSEFEFLPLHILRAVLQITRYPDDTPGSYYGGIASNPLALRVKLADVADNSDESRLALLNGATSNRLRRKYAKALRMLGQDSPNA